MMKRSAEEHLELAKAHLDRVQVAAWDPVDWADIGNYGDVPRPEHLDPEDVAAGIEAYVCAVEKVVEAGQNDEEID